jgi:hypothetical protein
MMFQVMQQPGDMPSPDECFTGKTGVGTAITPKTTLFTNGYFFAETIPAMPVPITTTSYSSTSFIADPQS